MGGYEAIEPIDRPIPATRQRAKRHYGVHPYFTRRPFNVVREYILHYSRPGDAVLDPFGGSGVTAIEAFLENRKGIQNDINPLANFIARGVYELSKGNVSDYKATLLSLDNSCRRNLENVSKAGSGSLKRILSGVDLPKNIRLASSADVENYFDLFSLRQLVSLAILRKAIDNLHGGYPRKAMLLAWSATLGKLNKTFLSANARAESRGGSSIFSIYRYKIANRPVELPAWDTFYERALNVISAKQEIDRAVEVKRTTVGWSGTFEDRDLDIEDLSVALKGKVDYIFTDPPYGGHISYLDLSTLWNNWLGFDISADTRRRELIVGGELQLSEDIYVTRLNSSVRACFAMLKPRRWLSVVFQHWNVRYFEAILSAAEVEGGILKGAISQVGDPIWSMHKKKNKESVLAGELILTFFKGGRREKSTKKQGAFDVVRAVQSILNGLQADQVYGEYVFNRLIIDAWNRASIDHLNLSREEFSGIMNRFGWEYDPDSHSWIRSRSRRRTLFDS